MTVNIFLKPEDFLFHLPQVYNNICIFPHKTFLDLDAGETLDGIGGFSVYGLIEMHSIVMQNNYLPIGLSEGCVTKRKISKDEPVKYEDIEIPKDSVLYELRKKQDEEIG